MSLTYISTVRKILKNHLTVIYRFVSSRENGEKFERNENKFVPVYRMPNMWACALINKAKGYQLAAAGISIPIALGLQAVDLLSSSSSYTYAFVGVASNVALLTVGQAFTNLVGAVYVSNDNSTVKISYLDFWGRRHNKIVTSEQILGVTHLPVVPWSRLKIINDSTSYKISLPLGDVLVTPLYKNALKHDPDVR